MSTFTVTQPTQIHYGPGTIDKLPQVILEFQAKKPLVVLDPGLVKAGLEPAILEPLRARGMDFSLFTRVDPEPGLLLADDACTQAKENGCDCVVGIGGGSAMDVAKAAAILVTNGGKAEDYLGLGKITRAGLPKIMVPTSAGTGAEVTFTAVFINEKTGSKGGMNGDPLYPDCAILDPELTLSLPPHITAATGIDALTHALEAYTSIQAHPISEMYSIKAITLIMRAIRQAFSDGRNLRARGDMLLGSLLAGKALATAGVGLVHAMAYPLGGMFQIPHGLANAVLLPYVVEYNLIGNLEKHVVLARLLGEKTTGLSERQAAEKASQALHQLNADLNIPATLQELGINPEKIPEMADIALTVARPVENNPRQPSREAIMAIYAYAMAGQT